MHHYEHMPADPNAQNLVDVHLRAKAIESGRDEALRSAYGFLIGAIAGVRLYGDDRSAVSMLMLSTRSIMRGNPDLDGEINIAAELRGKPVERKNSAGFLVAVLLALVATGIGAFVLGRSI